MTKEEMLAKKIGETTAYVTGEEWFAALEEVWVELMNSYRRQRAIRGLPEDIDSDIEYVEGMLNSKPLTKLQKMVMVQTLLLDLGEK